MPNDNGKLLISDEEFKNSSKIFDKHDILKFIKPFVGAREFINNKNKWCIWLHNEQSDWRSNKYLKDIYSKSI